MDARAQLDSFIDKFAPEVAADARYALAFLSARFPTATQIVYDNYNALAIGFGSGDKASDAVLSIAVYPKYATLFLLNGVNLPDPEGLLEGSGSRVRHIKLRPVSKIETPEVNALIDTVVAAAEPPLPADGKGQLIIKSVSPKQRPRRPGG